MAAHCGWWKLRDEGRGPLGSDGGEQGGGDTQLWDVSAQKLVRTMQGHSARVGALSWKLCGSEGPFGAKDGGNDSLIASGSPCNCSILLHDPRSERHFEMKLDGHKSGVRGLRWGYNGQPLLASGGRDNELIVWDARQQKQPLHTLLDHKGPV
ncbi:hypothetical protein ACHAWF_007239 [Thalassiosira exigua]